LQGSSHPLKIFSSKISLFRGYPKIFLPALRFQLAENKGSHFSKTFVVLTPPLIISEIVSTFAAKFFARCSLKHIHGLILKPVVYRFITGW
jgi:hypothetical protein